MTEVSLPITGLDLPSDLEEELIGMYGDSFLVLYSAMCAAPDDVRRYFDGHGVDYDEVASRMEGMIPDDIAKIFQAGGNPLCLGATCGQAPTIDTLAEVESEYLRVRGFEIVDKAPEGKAYLYLGEEIDPDGGDDRYVPEMRFYHKGHSDSVNSGAHPNRESVTKLVFLAEKSVVRWAGEEVYSVPEDEKIPVVVKDSAWNEVVDILMAKYK